MFGLSSRAASMPPSPIRKLAPYADAAKARGIQIYHLNIGQPDIDSPEGFWNAVQNTGLKVLEYSPSQGIAPLRERMARHYQSLGFDIQPDNIITTTAGSEALNFALLSVCNPGEEVVVPEPMYANYIGFSTAASVNVVPLTTRIDEGFRLPEVA